MSIVVCKRISGARGAGGATCSKIGARLSSPLRFKATLKPRWTDGRPDFNWDRQLEGMLQSLPRPASFVPFQIHDIIAELQQMKCRSAVGPDGISVHLLRSVAAHETIGADFCALVNHIIATQEIPANWHKSFLALLAKVPSPQRPQDLRPICVSSAFNKLVNRLACSRFPLSS